MLLLHHPTEKHKKSEGDPLSSPSVTQLIKELAKGHIMLPAPLSLKQFSFPKTVPSPNKQREFLSHILLGYIMTALSKCIYTHWPMKLHIREKHYTRKYDKLQIDTLI
jgi:hypothetical protein